MKQLLSLLIVGIFVLTGCGFSGLGASDFTPPTAPATLPRDVEPNEGPFQRELRTATSTDGVTFTDTGNWVAGQANVPDLVRVGNTIYLYYTGWVVGDRLNASAVAISDDEGETWTYKYLEIEGNENYGTPADPDVVVLEDGTFRLYFTSGNEIGSGIFYAEGTDGVNFEYKGVVFQPVEITAGDATVALIDGLWHMWTHSSEGVDSLFHLTSEDGLTFDVQSLTSFPADGEKPHMTDNGLWIDDTFHLFVSGPDGVVRSMRTDDGFDWYSDEGVRLDKGDREFVKGVAMTQLKDGTWLMVYTTNMEG